jgi:hypothetical protein
MQAYSRTRGDVIMSETYRAILKKNRIQWCDGQPSNLKETQIVEITIPDENATMLSGRGQKMSDALEKLAALNARSQITDPSAWQREIREDRPLPDRDR